jgi:signal transduction histidine kinase
MNEYNPQLITRFSLHPTIMERLVAEPVTEIIQRDQVARLLAGQNRVLRLLAEGKPLAEVLRALCYALEEIMPGSACTVLRLDAATGQLHHVAAPSLPSSFAAAIDGSRIGPMAGSCGTAAYLGEPVVVADIATDPRWAAWKGLAARYGLSACWSVPIFDRERDEVLGTFAVYYRDTREPSENEMGLVMQSGDLAGVAIRHDREREALQKAKEEAEAANETKTAFLAMANHELRTPLQAILGYAEFLLEDPQAGLSEEQRVDLSYIQLGGRRMLAIVNDLLDLVRIEAGGLTLRSEPVDLAQVVEEVRQDVQPQAAQRHLDLRIDLPENLPLFYGDGERLRQILLNLAGNAVKFTETGSVEIAVEAVGEFVAFHVRDTGYGIPADALSQIFNAYHQADHGRASRQGAGLGLAIAQRLATMMNGEITVESTLGMGSTFTLRLPMGRPAA